MIRSILESLKNNKNKLIAIFLAGFLLSACDQEHDNIEADDFGFPKKVIYAKGKNVTGEEENQLSEWIPTGYRYNGDQVVIMVYNRSGTKSTWNSWFCAQEDSICDAMLDAPSCQFPEGYCHEPGDIYETINNAPCYLEKGEGLYLLITDPNSSTGITDPNTYESVNRLPSSANFYTKHLTDKTSMYHNGVVAHGYSGELTPISVDPLTGDETVGEASTYLEGEAYFKILDRYYEDNSGYQKVSMKRGFDQIIPPPIASIISFVTDTMDETAESMYRDIVAGSEYRLSLKILLVLYIVVHGILYIGGASDMSQREMVSMFIRMIIVIQLTTGEESWKLFNDYFFKFFTEGLEEMISIVTSNLSDGTGDSITFFDKLLGLLFSYETSVKIYASIWSYPSGFIVAIVTYVAFAMFAIAIAKAVMLYLLSYMAISLLIIVAPIFICFMLFETTKSLFENWINQFAVFFLQSVMVLAALNLLAQIIVDQIYMMYGFKACFEDWMFVGSFVIAKSWFICSKVSDTPDISGSTPAEVDQTCSDTLFCNIEVPGYGYNDPLDPERYCEPYECMDYRHVELPFLDPDVSREADLIDAFQSLSSLSTPMLYEACILLLMCYLMLKFNDVVPGLAKGIAGGGGGTPAIANAANSITQDFKSALSGAKNFVGKAVTGKSERERGAAIRTAFNENKYVKGFRESGFGQAASVVYKTAGFIKDTIIPPGSLTSMIQNHSAEEAQAHRNKLRDARESQRMADANEGYVYDKSYMDQRQDSYEKRSYVAGMREKIRQGAQKFDLDNAEAERLGKAKTTIHGVFTQKVGEKLYETKAGKAVYDGFVGTAQLFKDEIKKFGNAFKKRSDELAYKGSAEYAKEQARKWEADRPAREAREKQTGEAYADLGLDKKRLASLSPARRREIVKEAYTRLGMEYYRARDNGDLTADQKLQKVEAAYQYLDSLGDHKRANQLQNEAVRNDNKPTGIPSILEKGMDKPRETTSERTQEEYKASYLERYEKDMVREKANQDNLLVNEALALRLSKKEQLLYDLLDKDPQEQKEIAKKALNKSLDNLNFSKKDILLFNALDTKGQQEMIQDALNKFIIFGICILEF